MSAALDGLLLGAGLIIAIGAQNAFVLRQGIARRHVLVVVALCTLSDMLLIAAGVAGLGGLIAAHPDLVVAVTLGGVLFLSAYALRAARAALDPGRLDSGGGAESDPRRAIAVALALTWLNPHVYLDTVVLLGGLSSRFAPPDRLGFALGAMAASLLWFVALGYGARLLAPLFARPGAWRALDLTVAAIMAWLAGKLAWSLI